MGNNTSEYINFEFEQMYYLFTRVSGEEKIFREKKNYIYFLTQFIKYLMPYLDVYAYCLAPQHLQFLISFKSEKEISNYTIPTFQKLSKAEEHKLLMQPISNLLNSYAKAYNKMYKRTGALFVDYIKREKIEDEESLKATVLKIHQLPIITQSAKSMENWPYSSYYAFLNINKSSKLKRKFILDFFEDQNKFVEFHQKTYKVS